MLDEHILLRKFKLKFKGKTYKYIAEKSGFNLSRVFRIFNGSKITYSEALMINEIIGESREKSIGLVNREREKEIEEKIYRTSRLEKIIGYGELNG